MCQSPQKAGVSPESIGAIFTPDKLMMAEGLASSKRNKFAVVIAGSIVPLSYSLRRTLPPKSSPASAREGPKVLRGAGSRRLRI